MQADHFNLLLGEATHGFPPITVVDRAEQGRPASCVPCMGLESVEGKTMNVLFRDLIQNKPHVIHVAHAGFGERNVINVRDSQRLSETPSGMSPRGQGANGLIKTLQDPTLESRRVLFRMGHKSCLYLNGLVPCPVHLASRS